MLNYQFYDTPWALALSKEKDPISYPTYNWLGWYVGANLGYGTNLEEINTTPSAFAPIPASLLTPRALNVQDAGFMAGGQIGYNWIKNNIIIGLEGDSDYAHISSANTISAYQFPLTTSVAKKLQWVSSIRARLGALASDKMLVFLTAGPAWGRANLLFVQNPEQIYFGQEIFGSTNKETTKFGWTAGGGIEYAVTDKVAFKAEYLYLGLGNVATTFYGSDFFTPYYQVNSKFDSNLLRLGVNYKI